MKIHSIRRPGAGKTTFAHALCRATGIALHHVDKHFFDANWVPTSAERFNTWQNSILAQKEWIIEGNGTRYLLPRAIAADLIIILIFRDYSAHGACSSGVFAGLTLTICQQIAPTN